MVEDPVEVGPVPHVRGMELGRRQAQIQVSLIFRGLNRLLALPRGSAIPTDRYSASS